MQRRKFRRALCPGFFYWLFPQLKGHAGVMAHIYFIAPTPDNQ